MKSWMSCVYALVLGSTDSVLLGAGQSQNKGKKTAFVWETKLHQQLEAKTL